MIREVYAFPLSFAQQRLWFLHRLEPDSAFYNIPLAMRLSGSLHVAALQRALDALVARHESLRTTFTVVDGEPAQVVGTAEPVDLSVVDLSGSSAITLASDAERLIEEEAWRAFDLERGPVCRMRLFRLEPDEHVLVLVMHHIVGDGWSVSVLFRELNCLYNAFAAGEPSPLPEPSLQYADFAVWQREWLSDEVMKGQLAYWRNRLADAPTALELPTDYTRPALRTSRGAVVSDQLSCELLDDLRALSRQEGVTLFMTLLAALKVVLARHTGQEDLVVGTPIANRPRPELEQLIGFFMNSLALRTDLSGDPTFRTLLHRVRDTALGAYTHQDLPFERLVAELRPERVNDRNPVFQVMFTLQNSPRTNLELSGLTVTPLRVKSVTSKFDLLLHTQESADGLITRIEYDTDLFAPETIRRILGHYRRCLEQIVVDAERRISSIALLSERERRQLLKEWGSGRSAPPAGTAVNVLFEAQVARTPQAIALSAGDRWLTYRELNERANRLAQVLRRRGVGPDVRVGVALERSSDLLISCLAILKAGGAYLPLDLDYPDQRISFMIEDARVALVIANATALARLPTLMASAVDLDREADLIGVQPADDLERLTAGDHLAYVLYTSGSTGRPKAVAMPHGALCNLVAWQVGTSSLGLGSATLQFAPLSFDVSFQEMFATWCSGGTLVLAPDAARRDPDAAWSLLTRSRIARLFLPFVALEQLAAAAADRDLSDVALREVITAGEALRCTPAIVSLFERLGDCVLKNQYGPTEAHVVSEHVLAGAPVQWPVRPAIGRPIANTALYVLDRRGHLVPPGTSGELYIGGASLARGYLGRPALTAERFVPNPTGIGRLYRTGDRCRHLPDGTLEFLGRVDEQVKVRGYRIEPGEVEAALSSHPAVAGCAVMVREDVPGDRRLIAYVVARDGADPSSSALREHLASRLPAFMVPSAFVKIESLPLSHSGKLHRRALPPPEAIRPDLDHAFVPPRTPVEASLALVWQELLGVERVGVTDDFFEVGGHSLLAVKLFAQIERTFGRRLPLSTLYQAPTIAQLALCLSGENQRAGSTLAVLQPNGVHPPLVLVHGVFGDLLRYRDLVARLGPEQPVYGLEAPVGSDGAAVLCAMEELAARHVKELRERQHRGPYFLCGYCWAGALAFEMACQLRSAGEDVALLALIDSVRPGVRRAGSAHRRARKQLGQFLSRVGRNLRRLGDLEVREMRGFLAQRLVNLATEVAGVSAYRWSRRLQRPLLPTFRQPFGALTQAGRSYRPRVYEGRVTLFRVANLPGMDDPSWGWSGVAAGGVELHDAPGEHLTLMHDPHVDGLAAQLRECIYRARGQRS
jgi:amino acid adenylation domain-containing protein